MDLDDITPSKIGQRHAVYVKSKKKKKLTEKDLDCGYGGGGWGTGLEEGGSIADLQP